MHDSFSQDVLFYFYLFNKGCKLPTARLFDVVEAWKKTVHANIVQLREVFLTKDFDDEQPCMELIFFISEFDYFSI